MFSLASADHKHLIVFDLEWNQSSYNPNHRMPHEIIEIGACRVDRNYRVVDTFSEVICPRVYKKLDKHIKSVTGITEAELAQGRSFPTCSASSFTGAAKTACWSRGAGTTSRCSGATRSFS